MRGGGGRGNRNRTHTEQPYIKYLDTDFGINAIPTVSWFTDRRNEGYTGFVTTGHTSWAGVYQVWSGTQEALGKALQAGMWIGLYGRSVEYWNEAIDNAGAYKRYLKFYLLDVETEDVGTHVLTRAMVDGVKAKGVRPIIYTASSMWNTIMSSSQAFSDVPLLDYIGLVTGWPTVLPTPNYGGWQQRIGAQLRLAESHGSIDIDDCLIDSRFIYNS